MKVIIVGVSTLPHWPGGEPVIVQHLADILNKNNIEYSKVCYNINNKKSTSILNKIVSGNFNYEFYKELFKSEKPDLIFGFTDFDFSYIFAAGDLGIPIIYDAQIYYLLCPKWTFYYADKKFCSGSSSIKCAYCSMTTKNYLGLINAIPFNFQKNKIKKYLNKIIAPSKFVSDLLVKNGFDKNKIEVIHNSIDLDFWEFSPLKKKNKKIIVYYSSAGANKSKGFYDFIDLCKRFESTPNVDFYATAKPKSIKKPCKNLKLVGGLNQKEILKLLKNSYAVIVPALWEEPFGLVVAQAMAVGRPVLAYKSGGISEQIKDGLTGFLVEKGGVNSLESKLKLLLDNFDMAKNMGRNGRKLAESKFDVNIMKKKYIKSILKFKL